MLAVLPSSVVLAAHTSYYVDEVDIAAAVRVTVALTVWQRREQRRVSTRKEE